MSNYLGYECIICKKKFNESDDVVVCPECGTPYHRECYEECGRCVNEELHRTGSEWKQSADVQTDYKKCEGCGKINKPHSLICEECGKPLVDDLGKGIPQSGMPGGTAGMGNRSFAFDPMDKCCGMDPDEKFEDVKLSELSDFVRTNQLYYLPIFKRMKDFGKKASVNIVSFIFPQLYFANRKMWLWTAVSLILSLVFSIPYIIYMLGVMEITSDTLSRINVDSEMFRMIYNAANYLNIAFKVLIMLFANRIYYSHALNKIREIKVADENASSEKIASVGGTSIAAIVAVIVTEFILTAVVYFILMR